MAWIAFLLLCGTCGYAIGRLVPPRRRWPLIIIWIVTPSTFWLAKAVVQGGPDMPLGVIWAFMMLVVWSTPTLLGFAFGHISAERAEDDS